MSYCVAYGCNNRKDREDCRSKSFFGFPINKSSVVKTWVKMMRRDNFRPTPYSKICSDHFDESCFEYQPFTNRRQLKPGSIPTIFVFSNATSRRIEERCQSTTSTVTYGESTSSEAHVGMESTETWTGVCEASTSTEAYVGMESTETWTGMEKETSKVSVGTQTVSFCELFNLLAQKEAELQSLKATLEEKGFVLENIKDEKTRRH
ncbi:THAP domain-containing protein 3 [Nephila pilipes]|uniref:THAP domain-containing protein 3 n=1 Tax=Nephila pilipes TaxID=299642 RepID=A0A8X6P5K3_NEPPI|nr:THAP domain-containing protein 3 [Nephila pilipes]